MNRYGIAVVCLLSVLAIAQTTQSANLVTNGDFAAAKDKLPVSWTLAEGNDITVDAEDKPSGVAQVLKVHIRTTAENPAGITQVVRNVPANTKLVLSGQIKGTDMRLGYLQVTLKKGGKVVSRLQTDWCTDDWKLHKIEFDTGDADELAVECRFSQEQKAMDQKIRFADIRLGRP
jgi:hypothetical protein